MEDELKTIIAQEMQITEDLFKKAFDYDILKLIINHVLTEQSSFSFKLVRKPSDSYSVQLDINGVFTIAYKEHIFTKQYIIDTYGPTIDWYSLRITLNKIIKNEGIEGKVFDENPDEIKICLDYRKKLRPILVQILRELIAKEKLDLKVNIAKMAIEPLN